MKGRAQPTYTPTKHRWLRTLADFPGSVRAGKGSPAFACMALGWTAWEHPDAPHGEVLTEAGREQLARWDRAHGDPTVPQAQVAKVRAPAPTEPARPPRSAPFEVRIGYALRGDGLPALADWLVFTGQDAELLALLLARAPRYHAGGLVGAGESPVRVGEVACELTAPAEHGAQRDLEPLRTPLPVRRSPLGSLGSAYTLCPKCDGRGTAGHYACPRCKGAGTILREVAPL